MHSLSVLRNACLAALDDDEESRDPTLFRDIVGPETVLELIDIAENTISQDELRALGELIRDLTDYIKLVPDEKGVAKGLDRNELITRARQMRGITGI